MHPLQYQRPTAAPKAGNIAQAEKRMAELGVASALRRRFAKLEEVTAIWKPKKPKENVPSEGVFGHLLNHGKSESKHLGTPSKPMTWVKFERDILPMAESIEVQLPYTGNYFAFVTAVDPSAPPMVQWDSEEKRNPVTHYQYYGGSNASRWNLSVGYKKVSAITRLPHEWSTKPLSNHGKGLAFIIDGARDLQYRRGGSNFPENLKSEYHDIRSTLEAHFKTAVIEGKDEATACGLLYQGQGHVSLRVTSKGFSQDYTIDRLE